MADNLNLIPHGFGSLHDMQYVRLSGPDAVAFAHAQFANDVQALAIGQWQWNAWLTAKGRVIAIFALLRDEDAQLLMLLPDGNAAEIAAQLGRFVFRRKLRITEIALTAQGAFAAPARAQAAHADVAADAIELDMGSPALPRTLVLRASDTLAAPIDLPNMDAAWRRADLQLGLVRLPDTQREQWTPQQLALDQLHAFSVKRAVTRARKSWRARIFWAKPNARCICWKPTLRLRRAMRCAWTALRWAAWSVAPRTWR